MESASNTPGDQVRVTLVDRQRDLQELISLLRTLDSYLHSQKELKRVKELQPLNGLRSLVLLLLGKLKRKRNRAKLLLKRLRKQFEKEGFPFDEPPIEEFSQLDISGVEESASCKRKRTSSLTSEQQRVLAEVSLDSSIIEIKLEPTEKNTDLVVTPIKKDIACGQALRVLETPPVSSKTASADNARTGSYPNSSSEENSFAEDILNDTAELDRAMSTSMQVDPAQAGRPNYAFMMTKLKGMSGSHTRDRLGPRDSREIEFLVQTVEYMKDKGLISAYDGTMPDFICDKIIMYYYVISYGWGKALEYVKKHEDEKAGLPTFPMEQVIRLAKSPRSGVARLNRFKRNFPKRDGSGRWLKSSPKKRRGYGPVARK